MAGKNEKKKKKYSSPKDSAMIYVYCSKQEKQDIVKAAGRLKGRATGRFMVEAALARAEEEKVHPPKAAPKAAPKPADASTSAN